MPVSFVILKKDFFERHAEHKEILHKELRPHMVLLVESYGRLFAIPVRTNATKTHARKIPIAFYLFSSGRCRLSKNGKIPALDYTKALLINENDIDHHVKIDKNEFTEVLRNIDKIKTDFESYVKFYVANYRNNSMKDLPEIKYSTMQYFISDLGDLLK